MVEAPIKNSSALDDWCERLLHSLEAPSGPMAACQAQSRNHLETLSAPHRRQEAWRFCDLAPIAELEPRQICSLGEPSAPGVSDQVTRLVLGTGQDPFAGVTLPKGLSPLSDAELKHSLGHTLNLATSKGQWPVALNQAIASQVIGLRVRGIVDSPLELVCDAGVDRGAFAVRVLLLLEEKAKLELLQVQLSSGANLTSVLVEAHLQSEAKLRHGLLAFGHPQAALLAHLAVEQEPSSDVSLVSVSQGWGVIRHEPQLIQLNGGAKSQLRALQLVKANQLADTHSCVRFNGPEGTLDQLHKVVAAGHGRSVFNGVVQVPREAQRTDAAQLSRSLLLSDRARIDTKPELEIVADDVKCAHGATVSRLQPEALFYLQSRGISPDQAAQLLLRAFCDEVICMLPSISQAWQPLARLLDGV
ncbi:FeS cluster assembly protein SufD [Prochlorococcus marinus str. MIT 1342]|uniref:SufB/SufD family protein n=1 Tax=Prochlorococcus TaxID=1218 RepID=UPI0007B3DCFF|nr:SufD family Fe-S cluster assembly protein [Prochlorococcus marinus]KZR83102.1 FeS cluster assembly protein SufD [Prochlorococcus marinus str. MIT 1342]